MKILKSQITYSKDESELYIDLANVRDYADRTNQDFSSAFKELKKMVADYDLVKSQPNGVLVFKKRANLSKDILTIILVLLSAWLLINVLELIIF